MNLRLQWVAEYHGPNILAAGPVVVAELMEDTSDAAPAAGKVAHAIAEIWAQSGMDEVFHRVPAPANPIHEDSLLAIAHAAAGWARAALNEVRGYVLHAGAQRVGKRVRMWLGFHQAPLSRTALQLALQKLVHLVGGRTHDTSLKAQLESLWAVCRRQHPDFQARMLMVAAKEMDIPFLPFLPDSRYWQFGWGAKSRVFFETTSNDGGALGRSWQRNKITSKELMHAMGLPTPMHVLVNQEDDLTAGVGKIGFPCVIKPFDGGGGKGVTANINSADDLHRAFRHARQFSNEPLMLEQHIEGIDHRLMVIGGKLVAAIRREASYVIGDGVSTVRELLNQLNASRFENLVKSHYLRPIPADEVLVQHLRTYGIDLEDVLSPGHKLSLRSNANRSTGGITADVTDCLHPQVRALAEQFALAMGLDAAGLDYLTTDITRPSHEAGGAFIEINATPGMAVFIAAGWTEAAIARLVLGDKPGRIPVDLTILSPDRLPAQLQALRSNTLDEDEGWVCGNQLCVGLAAMHYELNSPWGAVHAALRNPRLRRLHVYCSAKDIHRFGLPLDRFSSVDIQDPAFDSQWTAVLDNASQIGMGT